MQIQKYLKVLQKLGLSNLLDAVAAINKLNSDNGTPIYF